MYTRSAASQRRTRDATTTLSDDDDDDDSEEMSFTAMRTFLPTTGNADGSESILPAAADDASQTLRAQPRQRASKRRDMPPPAAAVTATLEDIRPYRVVDEEAARAFDAVDMSVIERVRPPDAGDVPAKYVTWRRRQHDFREKLDAQPWYRQALLVAAYAGMPIEQLVYVHTPRAATSRPALPPLRDAYNQGSLLNRLVRFNTDPPAPAAVPVASSPPRQAAATSSSSEFVTNNDDEEEQPEGQEGGKKKVVRKLVVEDEEKQPEGQEEGGKKKVVRKLVFEPQNKTVTQPVAQPPPGSPTTPGGQQVKNIAHMTVSGYSAEYNDALALHKVRVQNAVDNPNIITPELLALLRNQAQALEMLRRTEEQVRGNVAYLDAPEATGLVFEHPAWRPNQLLALSMVRTRYPQTLRAVTVGAFERSESCESLFALLTAAIFARGYYVAGKRPQHTSDYARYEDGITHAMLQLRFAVYDERADRVWIEYDALAAFRNAAGERAGVAHTSLQYATTPYQASSWSPSSSLQRAPVPYGVPFGRRAL